MFAFRDRLSSRTRYWLGFAVCPGLTWLLLGCQLALANSHGRSFGNWLGASSHTQFVVAGAILFCVFWVCVALFSGFVSAFFWRDFLSEKLQEEFTALINVSVTWAPLCAWMLTEVGSFIFLLLLPFFVFWSLYNIGLERGHKFWESSQPRQFLGDFSEVDVHTS